MPSYITAENIADYLDQLTPLDEDVERKLNLIADRATSMINATLGFAFEPYSEPRVPALRPFHALRGPRLYLPAFEPGSVSLVSLNGTDLTGKWYEDDERRNTLVSVGKWDWRSSAVVRSCAWPTSTVPIYEVEAVWGYGPPPDSVVQLTLEVAVNIWRSKDAGGFAETSGVLSGGAVNLSRYVAGVNDYQQHILEAVRATYDPPRPLELAY